MLREMNLNSDILSYTSNMNNINNESIIHFIILNILITFKFKKKN